MVVTSHIGTINRIVKVLQTCYIKCTDKFSARFPKFVKEAYALDRGSGIDLWNQAILNEKKIKAIVFKLLANDDEHVSPCSTRISYHMVFCIKFDMTCKAQYVKGGEHWRGFNQTLS
jgi:hypothetical protein